MIDVNTHMDQRKVIMFSWIAFFVCLFVFSFIFYAHDKILHFIGLLVLAWAISDSGWGMLIAYILSIPLAGAIRTENIKKDQEKNQKN